MDPHFTTHFVHSFDLDLVGPRPVFRVWCVCMLPLRCPECSCSCLFAVSSTWGYKKQCLKRRITRNKMQGLKKPWIATFLVSAISVSSRCWRHCRKDQLNWSAFISKWPQKPRLICSFDIKDLSDLPTLDLQRKFTHFDFLVLVGTHRCALDSDGETFHHVKMNFQAYTIKLAINKNWTLRKWSAYVWQIADKDVWYLPGGHGRRTSRHNKGPGDEQLQGILLNPAARSVGTIGQFAQKKSIKKYVNINNQSVNNPWNDDFLSWEVHI